MKIVEAEKRKKLALKTYTNNHHVVFHCSIEPQTHTYNFPHLVDYAYMLSSL